MLNRIRLALKNGPWVKLGGTGGPVEVRNRFHYNVFVNVLFRSQKKRLPHMNPGDGAETEDLGRSPSAISHVSSRVRHLDFGIVSRRRFRTYIFTVTFFLLFLLAPLANAQTKIDLEQAIQLALSHSHALQAQRTLVFQNQAQEITANLRPNPTLAADTQYFPVFAPQDFTLNNLNTNQEFDLGIDYLFERGRKRQRRLKAAQDQTAVTRAQIQDDERTLTFNVAQEFIAVLLAESTLQFSEQDLKGFQQTVDLAQTQYKAGYISEGDYLKIKLQLLQFQTDVSTARLATVQSLTALRQSLGYDAVPADYDVIGDLSYVPVKDKLEDLEAEALKDRPDLRASELGITSAQSQISLAKANGKQDVTAAFTYTHTTAENSSGVSLSMPLPFFDRNQGEIARTQYALTQAQQTERAASDQVLSDLSDAYNSLHSNDEVVLLYTSGYLKDAQDSRDISQYAYKRGAASLLDFLDAERSYRAVQLAYRQALSSYMTSLEQLKEAVGTRNLP
jgi:cobalt-zinc-cadmium efflux system outer membrane protein